MTCSLVGQPRQRDRSGACGLLRKARARHWPRRGNFWSERSLPRNQRWCASVF
ncbi:MAG: hypothetical protein LBR89_03655 [Holosporales bacterium]|nr:hypothetical protein [Holosporales bacterium]